MTATQIHLAATVIPISSPPIVGGAVAVRDGFIADVGPAADVLDRHPGAERVEWDGAMTPGLVNAHTHLQYTSFEQVGATPYTDFIAWSSRFVAEYDARRHEDWAASARRGVEMGLTHGTTCYSDIVTDVEALGVLVEQQVAGVAYFELIGVGEPEWTDAVRTRTRELVEGAACGDHTRVGISPHAPYSVDEPALRGAADLARQLGVRLHIHLAESDAEDAFYRFGTGALADRVASRVARRWQGLGEGGKGLGAAAFAAASGLLGPDSHVAHGVYLDEAGRRILRESGTYVALCPRSNATVGIGPPPIADYLREGNPIAVGTDSLGSSPSLNVLADVAALRRLARDDGYHGTDLDRRLLHAATLGGAHAVGLGDAVGSLQSGKRADLAIFTASPGLDPETALTTGEAVCAATLVAGKVRFSGAPESQSTSENLPRPVL